MSVILDALRKLDREKSSRLSGTAHIAVEILRPDLPRPGKRIPRASAIAFLTCIATAAITYGVMVKGGYLSKSSPPTVMNPPAPVQQGARIPISSEPVYGASDEIKPVLPEIEVPMKNRKPAAPSVEKKDDETKIKQNIVVKEVDLVPEKAKIPAERTPKGPAATSPSLNISAIVWYEEPSKRFAMINGLIVAEGAVVEGMKVEEIFPDRVRFLHNSQHFEISIK